MRFVFSFSKSISYDCNFSWKRAEDENRWRRYNRSGKFINEPAASDWQNVTKAQNNTGSHFFGKIFLATRQSRGRHLLLSGRPTVKKISNGGRSCYKSKWTPLPQETQWKNAKRSRKLINHDAMPHNYNFLAGGN